MSNRNLTNSVYAEFPSCSENEALSRAIAAAFLVQADPTMEELSDIKTAVSEAVTNCIVHGYPDTIGMIKMSCRLENNVISIQITDQGVGIEDVEQARTPLFTTGGEERSGMGFTIMERFMSDLKVDSEAGRGTTVTMTRILNSEDADL